MQTHCSLVMDLPKRRRLPGRSVSPRTPLGRFVRAKRLALELTQNTVNDQAASHRSFLSALEVGKKSQLTDEQVDTLARILQCDPYEILGLLSEPVYQPRTILTHLIQLKRLQYSIGTWVLIRRLGLSMKTGLRFLTLRSTLKANDSLTKRLMQLLHLSSKDVRPFLMLTSQRLVRPRTFGQVIRAARIRQMMSITDLAREVGVTRQHISQIELDASRTCGAEELIRTIAQVLQLDTDRLLRLRALRKQRLGHFR